MAARRVTTIRIKHPSPFAKAEQQRRSVRRTCLKILSFIKLGELCACVSCRQQTATSWRSAPSSAAGGGGGPAGAPSAQADPVDFVYHADMLGIGHANLTVGWSICSDIASGYSQGTIASNLVYHSFLGNGLYYHIHYDQAYNEVYWAQQDLCPWRAGTGIAHDGCS